MLELVFFFSVLISDRLLKMDSVPVFVSSFCHLGTSSIAEFRDGSYLLKHMTLFHGKSACGFLPIPAHTRAAELEGSVKSNPLGFFRICPSFLALPFLLPQKDRNP